MYNAKFSNVDTNGAGFYPDTIGFGKNSRYWGNIVGF